MKVYNLDGTLLFDKSAIEVGPSGGGGYTIWQLCQGAPDTLIDPSGTVTAVKPYCFTSCSNLSQVSLPNVSVIGASAFEQCSNLKTVYVPNVKSIRAYAFGNCINLSSIDLQNCEYIDYSAFTNCSNISEVSLPHCSAICSYAFWQCNNIRSIYLPECLSIGDYAFLGTSMSEALFPKLQSINQYALGSIRKIIAPECTYIKNGAFQTNGAGVEELIVPNVRSIGRSAFYWCNTIASISPLDALCLLDASVFNYATKIASLQFMNVSSISLYCFFSCWSLDTLIIRNISVPTLYNSAVFNSTPFVNSSYLGHFGSIYVPAQALESYKAATNWAYFADRFVALPEAENSQYIYPFEFMSSTMTEIPSEKMTAEKVGQCAFQDCASLRGEITLSNCEAVYKSAFKNCQNITKVTLPNASIIDQHAFMNCINLEEIHAPRIRKLESSTFMNCSNLRVIDAPNVTAFDSSYYEYPLSMCNNLEEVNMPNLEMIPYYAFISTKISFASFSKCSRIMANAFTSCYNLKYAYFDNCTSVSVCAFMSCSALMTAHFPKISAIAGNMFSSCIALTSIDASNITIIDGGGFTACSSLRDLNFPKLTSIGDRAFMGCTSIEEIDFPLVTSVSSLAFCGCSNMSRVCLNALTEIASVGLFEYCYKLEEVQMNNLEKIYSTVSSIFLNCSSLKTLSFPKLKRIDCRTTYTVIGGSRCGLEEVNLPELEYCGSYVFNSTSTLKSVYMPKALYVGEAAFRLCIALEEIELPECLSLGTTTDATGHAFSACSNLKTIRIPKIESIGSCRAFFGCNALTSMYLNSSKFVPYPENGFGTVAKFTIYVPASLVSEYQLSPWSSYNISTID